MATRISDRAVCRSLNSMFESLGLKGPHAIGNSSPKIPLDTTHNRYFSCGGSEIKVLQPYRQKKCLPQQHVVAHGGLTALTKFEHKIKIDWLRIGQQRGGECAPTFRVFDFFVHFGAHMFQQNIASHNTLQNQSIRASQKRRGTWSFPV